MSKNSNLNLGGLPLREKDQVTQPKQQVEDPTEQYDTTRKARQECLKAVEEVLHRAAQGSKINRKDTIKALKNLYKVGTLSDEKIVGLIHDLFKAVRIIAQLEVNIFALRTNLKTVVRALSDKGIVTEDEMREIHDKIILPQELPKDTSPDIEQKLRKEDLTKSKY